MEKEDNPGGKGEQQDSAHKGEVHVETFHTGSVRID